jgi:hypothetical protein
VEIYFTAGQATDDNTAQAHCKLNTKTTDAHAEFSVTIAFSTATIVT